MGEGATQGERLVGEGANQGERRSDGRSTRGRTGLKEGSDGCSTRGRTGFEGGVGRFLSRGRIVFFKQGLGDVCVGGCGHGWY